MKEKYKNYNKDRIAKDLRNVKIPTRLRDFIHEYSKVGSRKEFIWKWSYKVVEEITLSSVSVKLEDLYCAKVLLIMLVVLLDDSVDEKKDEELFHALSNSMSDPIVPKISRVEVSLLKGKRKQYFNIALKILTSLINEFKEYPSFDKYIELFRFDFMQMVNSMRYANLVSREPFLMNTKEYFEYFAGNMQGKLSGTVDLMASKKIDESELGSIRTILCHSQVMARIGNWLSTWRRELKDCDYSSVIFPLSVEKGFFNIENIKKGNLDLSDQQQAEIKEQLLSIWRSHYDEISSFRKKIHSIDVRKFQRGLENLLQLHLSSEGMK